MSRRTNALNQVTVYETQAEAVTPSDSTEFDHPSLIYVGVTGNVAVVPEDGSVAVTFTAVPAGTVVPVLVRKVMSTGTTATSMTRIF